MGSRLDFSMGRVVYCDISLNKLQAAKVGNCTLDSVTYLVMPCAFRVRSGECTMVWGTLHWLWWMWLAWTTTTWPLQEAKENFITIDLAALSEECAVGLMDAGFHVDPQSRMLLKGLTLLNLSRACASCWLFIHHRTCASCILWAPPELPSSLRELLCSPPRVLPSCCKPLRS